MRLRKLLSLGASVGLVTIGAGIAGASPPPVQYFTAMGTSFDGPRTLVAAGPLSATGTDTAVTNHRDTFDFDDGSLVVRHFPATGKDTYDSRTCVQTHSESGTYVVSKGTGAYAHATGSGHYQALAVGQGCHDSGPPTAVSFVIQARGTLTLG